MCELLVDGSQALAVTTPWCKEFDESWLAGDGDLIEIGRNEIEDGGFIECVWRTTWADS